MGRWSKLGLGLVLAACGPADGAATPTIDDEQADEPDPDPDMDGISVFATLLDGWEVSLVFTNNPDATCDEPNLAREWMLDGSCPTEDLWAVYVTLKPPHEVPFTSRHGGHTAQDSVRHCRYLDSGFLTESLTIDVLSEEGIDGTISFDEDSLIGEPLPPPTLHFFRPWCP